MALKNLLLGRIAARYLHFTTPSLGKDAREKRLAHIELPDTVDGERGVFAQSAGSSSYELIDENLLNRVINNVPFKNIPIIYITCTRNNTKIGLIDGNGNMIAHKSAGTEGYKHCRKGTTVAAQAVANRILTIAVDNDVSMVRMLFNGLGPGRNSAFKVFELSTLQIVALSDRTQAAEPFNLRPRAAKSI